MKFYSEKTKKMYDTMEDLKKAEAADNVDKKKKSKDLEEIKEKILKLEDEIEMLRKQRDTLGRQYTELFEELHPEETNVIKSLINGFFDML